MGGNVFTDLNVPRLPHELYHQIRLKCHQALEEFYEDVLSPPEAPDKPDHGDVDFLVARPKHKQILPAEIAKSFSALKYKHTANSKTTHFAVAVPGSDSNHAQVDVHVCPDTYFQWETFLQSYGDMMQILGILNRPIGLTANDKGLYLRIPEVEVTDRKKAMVFLTSDANEMMQFLRLDVDKYHNGFTTNEEVFRWCLQGKLYSPPKVYEETTNDRNRIRKRDMFSTCIREWFPEHRDELFPADRRLWTREEVLQEALQAFPAAKPVYEQAMTEHKQKEWESGVLADMRLVCPAGASDKEITEALRGSKRFVDYVSGEWAVSEAVLQEMVDVIPAWMRYIQNQDDKDRFLAWFKENWAAVHERERERMRSVKGVRAPVKGGNSLNDATARMTLS